MSYAMAGIHVAWAAAAVKLDPGEGGKGEGVDVVESTVRATPTVDVDVTERPIRSGGVNYAEIQAGRRDVAYGQLTIPDGTSIARGIV